MTSGVLNVDKPAGMTSAAVVGRVKRLLPRGTKVGHAGTLDPFATGVLVVLVGKATRLAEQFMSEPKQYEAAVKLGATTETLDPDSPEVIVPEAPVPSREQVETALKQFIGEIRQMPPAYSALKIGGKPAYALARAGKEVKLEPRPVRVYAMELLAYEYPRVDLRIDCGRGTYIRSIARDLGIALGSAGYLTSLRRTRVGPCLAAQAHRLEDLSAQALPALLLPAAI